MLATRFWSVFVALLLGAAVFVLFVGTSMYNRAGTRTLGESLSSDSQVVSWYLKDDARQRSAQLIQFTLYPDVARYLQKSNESEAKVPGEARDKLQAALKKVNSQIPAAEGFDAVFAVDQHGRVVAHLGYDQATGMDNFELGGYPVVADGLRGYLRDDTLVLDRIYRVVVRPVEYDTGQPPAGAIVGARIVDDRFARELSSRTGAAVAFYANGQRTASGAPEGFDSSQLDQIVTDLGDLEQDPDYQAKGRSKQRVLGKMLSVQYSRLPGEAWKLGAGYAVARLPFSVDSPLDFFRKADDKDKEQGHIGLAIAIALLAAAAGIGFSVLEYSRPLRVFRTEAQRLAKGEIDQLQPSRFQGAFRKIAADLNDGIDVLLQKGGGPRRGPADFKQVLGDLPAEPVMSAFSLPGDGAPPSSTAAGAPIPPSAGPASSGRALPQPPQNRRLPKPPGGRAGADAAPAAEPLSPPAASELGAWGAGGDEAAEWRAVYQEFVALKTQCGESVDGFTYEKFEGTLRKTREKITQQGAKKVKFSVYVKEGKAALKASPIKE
ncbi:MAG TPA: MXAN_5187 family protein [Polyangiaceae bacterium]|nr:MXAN_5187 family protein [Polyangiaceae bacterium]